MRVGHCFKGELTDLSVPARSAVINRVVMTVTQQDADDFGLLVATLAEKWAAELQGM